MKTPIIKPLLLLLCPLYLFAAGFNSGGNNNPNGNQPGNPPTNQPPPAPKYIDPVNGYMVLYDTNHDGRLDKDELKKMSVLDPTVYAQAMVFADKNGVLGLDELNSWRTFLKAQWTIKQQQSKSNGG